MSRYLRKRADEIYEGSKSVESLLNEIIDDTIKKIFGKETTGVIYNYLKKEFSLELQDILRKPEAFSTGLKKLIGAKAMALEKAIVENLYSKLQLEREEKRDFTFSDHIKFILSHVPRCKLAAEEVT